jgi:hypothetical protein
MRDKEVLERELAAKTQELRERSNDSDFLRCSPNSELGLILIVSLLNAYRVSTERPMTEQLLRKGIITWGGKALDLFRNYLLGRGEEFGKNPSPRVSLALLFAAEGRVETVTATYPAPQNELQRHARASAHLARAEDFYRQLNLLREENEEDGLASYRRKAVLFPSLYQPREKVLENQVKDYAGAAMQFLMPNLLPKLDSLTEEITKTE